MVLKHRRHSAAVVAILALGIAGATTMFGVLDAALLHPIRANDISRLVTIYDVHIRSAGNNAPEGWLSYREVASMRDLFSGAADAATGALNLTIPGQAMRPNVAFVTPEFFGVLGVAPTRGRFFSSDDVVPGRVAVISPALARRLWGDVSPLTRTITLNGALYEVVGVGPASFSFPGGAEIWLPLSDPFPPSIRQAFRGTFPDIVIGRLQPGRSVRDARARISSFWQRVPEDLRSRMGVGEHGVVDLLSDRLAGGSKRLLQLLMGATILFLGLAAASAANLLVAHSMARRREFATRAMLGDSPAYIAASVAVECLLLSLAGMVLGVLVAIAALRYARLLMPAQLIAVATPAINFPVLTFTIIITLLTCLLFGAWPTLVASRIAPAEIVHSESGDVWTPGSTRVRRLLVVCQVAIALPLLLGSQVVVGKLVAGFKQALGFTPSNVATSEVAFDPMTPVAQRWSIINGVIGTLSGSGAVDAAGVVNDLPLAQRGMSITVAPEGHTYSERVMFARLLQASGGYFDALGIPLLRGRLMQPGDDASAPHVVVINATMARLLWPNEDPIGKRLLDPFASADAGGVPPSAPPLRTVIGVVGDVREDSVDAEPGMQMYLPIAEQPPPYIAFVARGRGTGILARLRDAIRASGAQAVPYNVRMLDDVLSATLASRESSAAILGFLGIVAVVLAAAGLYVVVVFSVFRRSRELTIRRALGASPASLVWITLRESWLLALVGVGIGFAGGYAFCRVLSAFVQGISMPGVASYTLAALALLSCTMAAAALPGLRVVRLDPSRAMQAQ